MTNLYDFLRRIKADAEHPSVPETYDGRHQIKLTNEEFEWLKQYMRDPEHQLHFKSRQVGFDADKHEPIMALDFAISGDGFEIFSLLCEAMVENYKFADIVMKAASFYRDHIPNCPDCSKKHFGQAKPSLDWKFLPHKPIK